MQRLPVGVGEVAYDGGIVERRNQDINGTCELVCPDTKIPLRECLLDEARRLVNSGRELSARRDGQPPAIGETERVLLREDLRCAFPIYDGVPILLTPEMLTSEPQVFDIQDARWAEAYQEMAFYNSMFGKELDELTAKRLEPFEAEKTHSRTFPEPRKIWIDMPYDGQAQRDAFCHLASVCGKRVMQLGGHGSHAISFLLAGALEAWLITPIYREALFGMALAHRLGCRDRLRCVIGIGEQIPLADNSIDRVYAGGCLHHMDTARAISEVYRVLAPGGKFAAVDPWKTFLHTFGTKVCGKREKGVFCKPLTEQRAAPLFATFEGAEVRRHGPFFRYVALGFSKFFGQAGRTAGYWICEVDDFLPFSKRMGGSVALLGEKGLNRKPGGMDSCLPVSI